VHLNSHSPWPQPPLDSNTAPKYKKSSIPSTTTALHVVLLQPALPRADAFVRCLHHSHSMRFPWPCPRTSTFIPPSSSDPKLIISMALSLHNSALPLLPCCPSGLILSRRHISSHTQCSQLLPSMSVSSFTPLRVIVLLSLPALQLYNE
jgi:hypothetical protein